MNIFTLMESNKSSFSKTDHLIYNSIQKFPDLFAAESINRIIEETSHSQPSLTRFAKKLGFSGFNEFQFQFRRDLQESMNSEKEKSRAEIYSDQLRITEQALSASTINSIAERIRNSRNTYFFGTSLSRMPAEFLAEGIRIIGIPGIQSLPGDACPKCYHEEDFFLCFSAHSGHGCQYLLQAMGKAEHQPYSVLVTMNPKHPYRSRFDEVIYFPQASQAGKSRMVLGDTMAFMMFIDLLMNRLTELTVNAE